MKGILQAIRACIHYKVGILRNFQPLSTHYIVNEIKYTLKIPIIISLHDITYPPIILDYDHVITYVEWLKEIIIEKYGYKEVTVLLNRIDENFFKPGSFNRIPEEFNKFSKRIISIGRLKDSVKNQSSLIKAMAFVIKKYPDTLLLLIGDGTDRQKYEDLINELGLQNNIKLIGSHPQEMIVEYINWCDFHVLINDSGDIGKSLAETLVVGKPVVATGGKGNSKEHLTNGFNAKIVHYEHWHNPEIIASAIIDTIQNKHSFNLNAIRERAINEYGFEQLSRLEASIYNNVLKNYRIKASSFFLPNLKGKINLIQKIGPLRTFIIISLMYPLQIILTILLIFTGFKLKHHQTL